MKEIETFHIRGKCVCEAYISMAPYKVSEVRVTIAFSQLCEDINCAVREYANIAAEKFRAAPEARNLMQNGLTVN